MLHNTAFLLFDLLLGSALLAGATFCGWLSWGDLSSTGNGFIWLYALGLVQLGVVLLLGGAAVLANGIYQFARHARSTT